ncbi:hypothetical protein Tco_0855461 [Tanacetum coccineum]
MSPFSPIISGSHRPATVTTARKLFRRTFPANSENAPREPIYPTIYTTRPHSRFFPPPPAATAAATPSSYTTATPSPPSSSSPRQPPPVATPRRYQPPRPLSPNETTTNISGLPRRPHHRHSHPHGVRVISVTHQGGRKGAAAATMGRVWRAAAAIGCIGFVVLAD